VLLKISFDELKHYFFNIAVMDYGTLESRYLC